MTGTQTVIQITDLAGNTQSMGVVIETPAGQLPFNAPLSAPAGSGGADFSVGAPTPPLIGALVFGGASPFSTWVLLTTIPANFGACERRVSNNSPSPMLVVLDDGLASVGSTPTNWIVQLLNPLSPQTTREAFVSERFKGRIRVFGPTAGAWVTAFEC